MANTDEFHHGLRFKRVGSGLGAIDIFDTTTVGMNVTAPNADVSLPRNEPFLLFASDTDKREKLGLTGTAKRHSDILFNGVSGAAIIMNIFEEGADQDATLANAVGVQSSNSGLFALEAAQGHLGYSPKIMLTPGFTHFRVAGAANPVAIQQGLSSKRIGAVHLSSAPATTEEAAVEYRNDFDDERMIINDQMIKTSDGLVTNEAFIAAIGVQTDKEVGFHASWGNKILPGALGVNRVSVHSITESDTPAGYLLGNGVNCIINQQGGWRTWGDYAATTDSAMRFYCQLRVDDIINEALARHIWRVISDPLIADKVTAVLDRMNDLFSSMVNDKKLIGGEATFKGDRNSIGALELGKIVLSYKSFSPPPITLIDIEHEREPRYLEYTVADILSQTQYAVAA